MTSATTSTLPDLGLQGVSPGRLNVMRAYLTVCALIVVAAEIAIAGGASVAGVLLDGAAILLLVTNRWHVSANGAQAPPDALSAACAVIALLPILRLLSLTMPHHRIPEMGWYVLIGLPLLVVLIPLMGEHEHLRTLLRFKHNVLSQGLVALSGIPLGMLGYAIARPEPLSSGPALHNPLIAFLILTIFSGLMEEILFRGLLPDVAERFFGPLAGLVGAAALFAIFNVAGGLWFAIFALYYGLLFGLIVRRTGSLIGVAVAHGLLNTGLLVVWPQVWG